MLAVVKVLLCSDCRVGEDKAGSLEVTTLPEPGSILLEQWTVSVLPQASREPNGMDALSLLQAVRFDPFFLIRVISITYLTPSFCRPICPSHLQYGSHP